MGIHVGYKASAPRFWRWGELSKGCMESLCYSLKLRVNQQLPQIQNLIKKKKAAAFTEIVPGNSQFMKEKEKGSQIFPRINPTKELP